MNDIRLMQERAARLAALDAAIARGLADADAGRVRPVSEVFDRLEAKYRAGAGAVGGAHRELGHLRTRPAAGNCVDR
jgi:hypothetical protein